MALTQQVDEKRMRDQADNERNKAYDADMIKNSQICTLLDERQNNDTRKLNAELNKFRLAILIINSFLKVVLFSWVFNK